MISERSLILMFVSWKLRCFPLWLLSVYFLCLWFSSCFNMRYLVVDFCCFSCLESCELPRLTVCHLLLILGQSQWLLLHWFCSDFFFFSFRYSHHVHLYLWKAGCPGDHGYCILSFFVLFCLSNNFFFHSRNKLFGELFLNAEFIFSFSILETLGYPVT